MVEFLAYLGLAFTSAVLVIFLSFIGAAFPQWSSGTNMILVGIYIVFICAALLMAIFLKINRGRYVRMIDLIFVLLAALIFMVPLAYCSFLGQHIAAGG